MTNENYKCTFPQLVIYLCVQDLLLISGTT